MSSSIIKSDNGVTSGVTGIVQSAGSDGTLLLQTTTSGGTATTAMTIDNSQKVTFANSLTPSTTAGIVGTTLGDNANAGSVGEYISSSTSSGGTPASGTTINITSISLTAGDWDVYGGVGFNIFGGSVVSQVQAAISLTSATIPSYTTGACVLFAGTITTGSAFASPVPSIRVNVSTTTTVYLCGFNTYTGTATTIGGNIYARRRR